MSLKLCSFYPFFKIQIPDKDVGLCIGRQGCVIREMQSKTNTRIQIPSHPVPGETQRIATVTGPKEGCEQVRAMIQSISAAQSSAPVMSGTYNQQQPHMHPHAHSHYAAPQPAQQQYSAEWAAYHAAQAAAAAAQQQQQQQYSSQPAPAAAAAAPAAAQQPASDAYYEQFFRYAYYYGEEAARAHYKTWSPPVGTPNPYGVNPAGITPAPATADASTPAAAAAAPVAAAAPAPVAHAPAPADAQALETGRRKVSNLPAWMTKGQG